MTSLEKLTDERSPESPARPLRADAERNRQRLLAAAEEVFAERGLDATLDEIAAHAGVGVGTAYRRFANKLEVIEALFEIRMTGMVDLAEACALMPAGEGLGHFLHETCSAMTLDRGFRDVLIRGDTGRTNVGSLRERILPILSRLVEVAQEAGTVRSDFRPLDLPMIIVMMESVADATDRLDPHLWRRYLALVLDGIANQTAARSLPGAPLDSSQTEQAMRNRSSRSRH